MKFTSFTIPNLENKKVIITGANSGIGFEVAKRFAEKNAHVIFACRNKQKADKAIKVITKQFPNAKCEYINLNLQSFTSIKKFITAVNKKHPSIDILINNAGIIMHDSKNVSKDGFEPHIATNCLGPFMLTTGLLNNLKKSKDARIVTVSSCIEKLNFFNLKSFPNTKGFFAYTQSKIANLLLTYELDRRLKAEGIKNVIAVASHPGLSRTNTSQLGIFKGFIQCTAMPAEKGAMSLIIAATEPSLKGGEYLGYDNLLNIGGNVSVNKSSNITHNKKLAHDLWAKCEELIK